MDIATGAAASGIRAGIARLDAAGHSIANVNTRDDEGRPVEGRRVVLQEGDPGVRATEQGTGQPNEPVGPMVDAMIARQEVAANASVLRTAHETYQDVIDVLR